MKKLYDLVVDKISLITSDKKPAVEKANSKFFSVTKLKRWWTEEQIQKLQEIKKQYQKS